jgi:hypothetical protein
MVAHLVPEHWEGPRGGVNKNFLHPHGVGGAEEEFFIYSLSVSLRCRYFEPRRIFLLSAHTVPTAFLVG